MSRWRPTYTVLDRLMASPCAPMPKTKAQHQLLRMYQALRALETAAAPTPDDWRVVSDAVNLMETLVSMGHAQDASGLLRDAVAAMAVAGARHVDAGQPIRLDGAGIQAVRGVLQDYAEALAELPARVMVEAHRITEQRIHEILSGRPRPGDVQVVARC